MSDSDKTQLHLIKEQVVEHARLLNEVLKVDVEIVDHNIGRVAGTGYYESSPRVISDGIIYDEVLRTGRYVVIQNPRKHELCERCANRDRCLDKMEIACPIIHNGRAIGAIGLICSTHEQKLRLMENIRTHMFLIAKACGFLGVNVGDYERLRQQEAKIIELEQKIAQGANSCDENNIGEVRHIEDLERREIEKALNKFGHDTDGKRLAAKSLGIGIATLYRKLDRYKAEN